MPTKKAPQRGGSRPGAGRKPVLEDAVPLSFSVPRVVHAALVELASENDASVAEVVRGLLHSHPLLGKRLKGA